MKDLGLLSYFQGIVVTCHVGGMFLSQKNYATKITERVGISSCEPSPILVDTKSKLSVDFSLPYEDPSHYCSLVGALQYLTFTESDIYYAMQHVCLFMHDPLGHPYASFKRIIHYVHITLDHGPHLYPSLFTTLISYMDVDWGGCCPDTR